MIETASIKGDTQAIKWKYTAFLDKLSCVVTVPRSLKQTYQAYDSTTNHTTPAIEK